MYGINGPAEVLVARSGGCKGCSVCRVEGSGHGIVCLSGKAEEDHDAPEDKIVFVPVDFLTRVATSVCALGSWQLLKITDGNC